MVLKFSSQEEYDELLASDTSIVIFTANWCKLFLFFFFYFKLFWSQYFMVEFA